MKRVVGTVLVCLVVLLASSVSVMAVKWSEPVLWEASASVMERLPWLSGDSMFLVRASYDVYQSDWDGSSWSVPVKVQGEVNTTSANEINPVLVKGGTVMYFLRYSAETDYDVYRSEWDAVAEAWGTPVKIEELSTNTQEWDLWMNQSETVAYITTKGTWGDQVNLGGRDIYRSERVGGKWSMPVNLGEPINSASDEWSVAVDHLGHIYFESNRAGGFGGYDIYMAESVSGPVVNVQVVNSDKPERDVFVNEKYLIFAAENREGGKGHYDIWISTRIEE
jgi:hypothetical protein